MKRNFYFIFILFLFSFFFVEIDKVFADNVIFKYINLDNSPFKCKNLESNGKMEQSIELGVDKPYSCTDSNFKGWGIAYGDTTDNKNYIFCDDGSGYPIKSESSSCDKYYVFFSNNQVVEPEVKIADGSKFKFDRRNIYQLLALHSNEVTNKTSNGKSAVTNHQIEFDTKSCVQFSYKECPLHRCSANKDVKGGEFCSPNGLIYLSCGDIKDIPYAVPKISSYIVTLLKTVAPIVLIIVSIVTLVKSITAGKDDEINKAKNSLVKKFISAGMIFFVITIVQFVMLKVTANSTEHKNLSNCLSCFLNGVDKCGNLYFKDGYGKCYNVLNHSDSYNCVDK